MIATNLEPSNVQNSPENKGLAPNVGVQTVIVPLERAGQRLDNYLMLLLKGVPKGHIYRLMRTGQVRLNSKRCKPDTRIVGGETLRLPPLHLPEKDATPVAAKRELEGLSASIIHDDKRFLVFSKPSGLASHGGSGIRLGLIEQARQLFPKDSLELVHRLDRDTSGVIILARKRSALAGIQTEIREGRASKHYLALLAGVPKKRNFSVDAPLRKSQGRGGERIVSVAADGKESLSHFSVIQNYGSYALCEVKIETGRTHQIRVHAAYAGFPVLGDSKYGESETNAKAKKQGLKRLFLHAARFEFDLEDQSFSFTAPLADDLRLFLQKCEGMPSPS